MSIKKILEDHEFEMEYIGGNSYIMAYNADHKLKWVATNEHGDGFPEKFPILLSCYKYFKAIYQIKVENTQDLYIALEGDNYEI